MGKIAPMLAVAVSLLVAGLVLSFYGSQLVTSDLVTRTGIVGQQNTLEVTAELDADVSETGVYVVQIMDFEGTQVTASVYDPLDIKILEVAMDENTHEEWFDIAETGSYRLVVGNAGSESEMVGVLGHLPASSALTSGVIGFYVVLLGLVAMGALEAYGYKLRRQIS